MTAWLWLPLAGLLLLSLLAERLWRPRLGKEKTIEWALWQLPRWFVIGAVPTYLLGVICSTIRGEAGWSSIGAILGGAFVGFGLMTFIAVPFVDLGLGVPRRRVLRGGRYGRGVAVLPICLGVVFAIWPLFWPNRFVESAPTARRAFVQLLESQDPSLRRQSADALRDIGTQEEIPALERALAKAHESGDKELENICERSLARIRRR
jgi:hypothetical protein